MNPSRAAAWFFVAAVLGAWLASAAGVSRSSQRTRAVETPANSHPVDTLAADVQAQALKLRARMETAPAPQAPVRNPFAFSPRVDPRPRVAQPVRAQAFVPPAAVAPAEPVLQLIGVAERKVGESVVRTAMISTEADDLIMVTAGQRILGAYDVVAVSLDVVELRDIVSGVTRRLALR